MEDDAHLFFHCHLCRAVWFSTNPLLRTDDLPQESDGVQLTLQALISTSTSNALFHKILITMWTPWQVHPAVTAHIATQVMTEETLSVVTEQASQESVNRD